MKVPTKSLKKHQQDVDEVRQRLLSLKGNEKAKQEIPIRTETSHVSNTAFNLAYVHWGEVLGIDQLNSILLIDKQRMMAVVEPRVAMDQLAFATLEEGLLVPVVPEFKGITVGGAINGSAIESSSHFYGQFNDICLAYEVLLGNGDLIRVTPKEYADLFYGLAGSYGSLGLIVSVELKLILAAPWVHLKYHHFKSSRKAINYIQKLCEDKKPPEFIEGLVFSEERMTVIEGRLASNDQASALKTLSLSPPWSPWYYQHVEKQNLEQNASDNKISIFDYLFRHDRGAFWMGAYALHWRLFLRYFLETQLGLKRLSHRLLGPVSFKEYCKIKKPNFGFRSLCGWWMSSRNLYRMLHACAEKWFEEKIILQDYFIPVENAESFMDSVITEMNIFPLWLCPVKATRSPQIFSPHYLDGNHPSVPLMIDVGIYGMPKETPSLYSANKSLDQNALKLKGRKMLYSFCYYSSEDFWKIYPREAYECLRERYHAKEMWTPIYDKISQTCAKKDYAAA